MTDREKELHDLLCLVLWTKPYAKHFSGGLPADWIRRGAVTALRLAEIHVAEGVDTGWDTAEIAKYRADCQKREAAVWRQEQIDAMRRFLDDYDELGMDTPFMRSVRWAVSVLEPLGTKDEPVEVKSDINWRDELP